MGVTPSLERLLDCYSSAALRSMAGAWVPNPRVIKSKGDCVERLTALMSRPTAVASLVATLNDDGQLLLATALDLARPTVEGLIYDAAARGVRDAAGVFSHVASAGLVLLERLGSEVMFDLGELPQQARNPVHVLPGVAQGLRPLQPRRESLAPVVPASVSNPRTAPPGAAVAALLGLAGLAGRRSIRLTKDGWVTGAQLGVIERELSLEGPLCAPMLAELALALGLVEDSAGRLRPTEAAAHALDASLGEATRRILAAATDKSRFYDDVPLGDLVVASKACRDETYGIVPLPSLINARRVVTGILRRLKGDSWMDLDALVDLALTLAPGIYTERDFWRRRPSYARPETASEQAIQEELVRCFVGRTCFALGLVELGDTGAAPHDFTRPSRHSQLAEGFRTSIYDRGKPEWRRLTCGVAFRLTPLGREVLQGAAPVARAATPCLIVGADFEVVAPVVEAPPDLLARLETLLTPVKGRPGDPVRRYRIEQDGLLRAMAAGATADGVLDVLEAHARRPVPDNVARTVRDWARRVGAVTLYLGHDLVEITGERTDGDVGPVPVGDRFGLVSAPAKGGTVIDYAAPPTRSLSFDDSGRIHVHAPTADLVLDATLRSVAVPDAGGWRLDRDTIRRSRRPAADLLATLDLRVIGKVPRSVRARVMGHSGEVKPPGLATLTVVKLHNAQLAQDLLAIPTVRRAVRGLLGPHVYVVDEDKVEDLLLALSDLGIEVEPGVALD